MLFGATLACIVVWRAALLSGAVVNSQRAGKCHLHGALHSVLLADAAGGRIAWVEVA
jgi:hypothetical protein